MPVESKLDSPLAMMVGIKKIKIQDVEGKEMPPVAVSSTDPRNAAR
jgi:hypothetical protein